MNDGNMAEGSAHLSPVTSNPINDFMGQMAQAYAALQRVPELEQALKQASEQSQRDGDKIASLELTLHSYRNEIAERDVTQRSLEVERDNAQFHGLELEERLHNLIGSLRGVGSALNNGLIDMEIALNSAEPMLQPETPPEPEPQVEPILDPISDHGVVHVTANEATPYAGKAYMEIRDHVSRYAWLAGGGTDYGYDWRSYYGSLDRDLLYPAGDLHVSDGKPESQSFTEYSGERRTIV